MKNLIGLVIVNIIAIVIVGIFSKNGVSNQVEWLIENLLDPVNMNLQIIVRVAT